MATVKWRTGGHRGEISVAEHKTQRRVASARARRTCPTAPAHGRDASQCQRRASEATRRGGSPRQCRSRSIDKMAALIRHGSMLQCLRGSMLIPNARTPLASFERTLKIKTRRTRVLVRKFEWDGKSLAARGFLRPTKSYEPAKDVPERFDEICKSEGLPVDESTKLDDPVKRFGIFVACEKAFNYPLPNSIIHTIETIGDLKNFYVTPINSTVPFEAMRKTDLPPNLHILYNYHRFHPDDDTKFGGKTAFPYSSTLVTGLKYKKKYQSLILRQGFP